MLAALLALAFATLAGAASAGCSLGKAGEFPVTMRGFQPLVPAKINGVDGMFLADTGAFFGSLTPEGVAKFKLHVGPPPQGFYVVGVNGRAEVGLVNPNDVTVLGQTVRGWDFLVLPHNLGSEDGILGDNLLSHTDAEFDFANGIIRFWEPQNCRDADLAYWIGPSQTYSEEPISWIAPPTYHILGWAMVNGVKVRVLFDTGSSLSMLTLDAAKRIGLTREGSDLAAGGEAMGVATRESDTWLAPIKTFDLGDEHVANTHLRVGKIELRDADMLIGADWFLSHRVYVAKSQNKIYFTYNGGPVFNTDQVAAPAATPVAPPSPPATTSAFPTNQPTDAAGFSRRGDAFLDRADVASAIADFSQAIALEPNDPKHYFDRGRARWSDHQSNLARSDFDQALKLKPDDVETLVARGALRLQLKDDAGATADFDAAIKADPSARFSVAEAYSSVRQYERALVQLDQWLDAYPKDDKRAAALNNRCWARAMLNYDLDKALADCNEALRLVYGDASFLDSRAMVYLRLGQFDRSIADYDTVINRQRRAWSLYGRGLAEDKKGLKAQGDADIAAATALDAKLPDEAKRFGLTL